ncbi:unnamed protein product [Ectocarpus sp. 12 AP-2014]
MPSKFIEEQAELLYRIKDPKPVLDNLREKYALSSFPSQMSRVKVQWCRYGERHEQFEEDIERGYRAACLPDSNCSRRAVKELKQYMRDDLITQMKKCRAARTSAGFSGDARIDDMIAKVPLLPAYMKGYRLSDTDRSSSSDLAKKSLEERSKDCVEIPDADALVERCTEKLKKNDDCPFIIAACLSVVCGRRSIELLKTGVFSEGKEPRAPVSCFFSGAAKKKVVTDERCEIPILIKYKYLKTALRRVREMIPCENLTNSQINAKYSHKLGDAAKIITNDMRVRFHDLRCIYGMVSFQMFQNNCSLNIWLKLALMHETLDTSVFYSRCKIGSCRTVLGEWRY